MTKAPLIILSVFILVVLFAGLSFALECPATSSDCIVVGGSDEPQTLCHRALGPDCPGGEVPDYPGDKWVWICGSTTGCTCFCPYVDKCIGVTCKEAYCDGDILEVGSGCSSDSGQCGYASHWCKFGCDEATAKCKDFVPEICTNTCSPSELQAPYPDCNCSPITCNPGYKLIADACVYQESCPAGYKLVADTCTPVCDAASCTDSCQDSVYDTSYLFKKQCKDGECADIGDPKLCYIGCKVEANGKGNCLEDCDNKIDDNNDGKVDCADPQCKDSLYCKCSDMGIHTGSAGGKTLNVIIGGYYYPATNESYNYRNRDQDTQIYANMVKEWFTKTDPISTMNMHFYVTRFAPNDWVLTKNDLLAKCPQASDGFTTFINFYTKGDSFSYMNSMSATIYRASCDRMPGNTETSYCGEEAVHEFGHGFGGLWDEYTVIEQGGFLSALGNTIDKAYFSIHNKNCAVADNEADCKTYFDRFNVSYKCVQGCSNPLWYRSSDDSVMHWDFSSGEYNEISKAIVRERIDRFFNPDKYITKAVSTLTSVPLTPGGVRKPIIGPMPKQ
ncbi:Uncharacterised protein [uncultured archaeon]|nr:Uncharacterised protein [uncultured archaeon]